MAALRWLGTLHCGSGITPLDYASQLEVARFLVLECGADVNRASNWGTTLHLACQRGSEEVAWFLLQQGADVNARDRIGWTALWCAYWGLEEECGTSTARM